MYWSLPKCGRHEARYKIRERVYLFLSVATFLMSVISELTRYMNIQNRGKASGPARIPQKAYKTMDKSVAKAPAISSLGAPAMSRCAIELANKQVATIIKSVWKARMFTLSVHSLLR